MQTGTVQKSFTSCNCGWCKNVPSKVKGEHKRAAHRKMRRLTTKAIFRDEDPPRRISTGYKY